MYVCCGTKYELEIIWVTSFGGGVGYCGAGGYHLLCVLVSVKRGFNGLCDAFGAGGGSVRPRVD